MLNRLLYSLLWLVPKNELSYLFGCLVRLPLPRPLARVVIAVYCRIYRVDTSEVALPVSEFRSLGAFFVRDLKPEVRPVEGNFVSPVDGTLRAHGPAVDGQLEQVKGKDYSIPAFLGDSTAGQRFHYYFNFYLSPRDYHHVHAPCVMRINRVVYIPGALWPVNNWSLNTVKNLFVINERVVVYAETEFGKAALVLVGATNVGRISLAFMELVTNASLNAGPRRPVVEHTLTSAITLKAGERVGTFHMGSTAVLLMERRPGAIAIESGSVKFGQRLLR